MRFRRRRRYGHTYIGIGNRTEVTVRIVRDMHQRENTNRIRSCNVFPLTAELRDLTTQFSYWRWRDRFHWSKHYCHLGMDVFGLPCCSCFGELGVARTIQPCSRCISTRVLTCGLAFPCLSIAGHPQKSHRMQACDMPLWLRIQLACWYHAVGAPPAPTHQTQGPLDPRRQTSWCDCNAEIS